MGGGFDRKVGGPSLVHETFCVSSPASAPGIPGKRTLVEQIARRAILACSARVAWARPAIRMSATPTK